MAAACTLDNSSGASRPHGINNGDDMTTEQPHSKTAPSPSDRLSQQPSEGKTAIGRWMHESFCDGFIPSPPIGDIPYTTRKYPSHGNVSEPQSSRQAPDTYAMTYGLCVVGLWQKLPADVGRHRLPAVSAGAVVSGK